MEQIGYINGKHRVFNYILPYVYSKSKLCSSFNLVNVISSFYPSENLQEARVVLFALVDPLGEVSRLPSKSNLVYSAAYQLTDRYYDLQ